MNDVHGGGLSGFFFMNECQAVGTEVRDFMPTLRLLMKLMPGRIVAFSIAVTTVWGAFEKRPSLASLARSKLPRTFFLDRHECFPLTHRPGLQLRMGETRLVLRVWQRGESADAPDRDRCVSACPASYLREHGHPVGAVEEP